VLLYVAALTAVVIGVGRASLLPAVAGAVGGVTVVCLVGLVEHYLTTRPVNPVEGKLLVEPFGYANALGMYATLGILLSLGLALSTRRLAIAPCLVLVPTLLLTSSRGALVALALGLVATLYFARLVPTRVLAPIAVIGVAAGLLLGANRGQLGSIAGENRPHYWHVAAYDVKDHPLLGSGAGTFGDYFWRYHRPPAGFTRLAHSLYLQTLAELGPLGLALLVAALVLPLAFVRGRQTPLVAAVAGAYLAFLLHAAIDWDWTVTALTTTAIFCGGATLVGSRLPGDGTVHRLRKDRARLKRTR
jgi:O-antigen ligase